MPPRAVQFHQTLHGYEDGHRLLRASRKLPTEVERLMLVMSDMSGPSMVRGFETYLTGYPLKEINAYALARTWYAPEMERPGCVWTHTLIIQNADLAYINDLWLLADRFERPSPNSKTWEFHSYMQNLPSNEVVSLTRAMTPRLETEWVGLVSKAIESLYGSPRSQVYLPVDRTSAEYERLTLDLWSQQWARLRRSFRFCTGSISDRKLPDGKFDWQIVPSSVAREIKREVPKAVFISAGEPGDSNAPSWVQAAVADLCETRPPDLRRFMRTFGVETAKGRTDFAALVEVFAALRRVREANVSIKTRRNASPVEELTESVARLFPSPSAGARLKTTIFGADASESDAPTPFSHGISEGRMLGELVTTKHYAAFDPDMLRTAERAAQLVKVDFDHAKDIAFSLLRGELTPLGEKFMDGFCEGLTSRRIFDLPYDQLDIIYSLLTRKPEIALSPMLWKAGAHEQRQLYNFIDRRIGTTREQRSRVVTAMLVAGSDAVAEELAYDHPRVTVEAVLAWCGSKLVEEVFNLGAGWKRTLTARPELCIRWLKEGESSGEAVRILLAVLLDPHSSAVFRGGANIWTQLARDAPSSAHGDILIAVMTFLLALGFDNPDGGAVELVVHAFEPVHTAAEQGHLSDANWHLLAYQSPSSRRGKEWDKCERMRNALVEHFVRHRWSEEDFLRCLASPVLLELVVTQMFEQGKWFNKHRKYIQHVTELTAAGNLRATKEQANVLSRILADD